MLGEAARLAADVRLPPCVRLRRIDDQPDPMPEVVRAAAARKRAFGVPFGVEDFMRRIETKRDLIEI